MRTDWKFALVLLLGAVLCLRCKYSRTTSCNNTRNVFLFLWLVSRLEEGPVFAGSLHSTPVQVVGVFAVNGLVTLLAKHWKTFLLVQVTGKSQLEFIDLCLSKCASSVVNVLLH